MRIGCLIIDNDWLRKLIWVRIVNLMCRLLKLWVEWHLIQQGNNSNITYLCRFFCICISRSSEYRVKNEILSSPFSLNWEGISLRRGLRWNFGCCRVESHSSERIFTWARLILAQVNKFSLKLDSL